MYKQKGRAKWRGLFVVLLNCLSTVQPAQRRNALP
jgi:hypothetical protein